MHCCWIIALVVVQVVVCTGGSDFECPTQIYFADAKGVTIRCEQFPSLDSKLTPCFKDLWWKYVVYGAFDQPPVDDADLYNILDIDVCKKTCKCTISLDLQLFDCATHGPPPRWVDDFVTQQRGAFKCGILKLPEYIADNLDKITLLATLPNFNAQLESTPVLLGELVHVLDKLKVEALEISAVDTALINSMTSLANFFSPERFKSLVSVSISYSVTSNKYLVSWPDAQPVIQNISSSVSFFTISDFTVPSIDKPPFADNLRTLTCNRCYGLTKVPTWISDASKLVFLHLSNVSREFPFGKMPPSKSLLYLSFTSTPLREFPKNFSLSALYPNLENLDLSNLNLLAIPIDAFQNLTKLRRLDLSGNCLMPIPSFTSLKHLSFLNLDGLTIIYGSIFGITNNPNAVTCYYGPCRSLKLTKKDLSGLTALRTLSVSYYEDLKIDDDVFSELPNLRRLGLDCINKAQLPNALRYACSLRFLSVRKNPFNATVFSDPATWPVPLFVPKFFKELQEIYFDYSNMKIIPPTLLMFNASKSSRLLQTVSFSVSNNALLAASPCEMHKYETAYKWLTSVEPDFPNSNSCRKEYVDTMAIAMNMMTALVDNCTTPTSTGNWYHFFEPMSLVLIGIVILY